MGLKEWRARRAMKDPVRGEFRPSGSYFPHPGRVPMQEMMTGVVLAPGVPPTPAEALNDLAGGHNGTMYDRLPALVDRADPARLLILWQEVAVPDAQADARRQADQAAQRLRESGPG